MNILFALIITIAIVTGVSTGLGGSDKEGEEGFDLSSLFAWLMDAFKGAETEVTKLADDAKENADKAAVVEEPVAPEPKPEVVSVPKPEPKPEVAVVETVVEPEPAAERVYRLRWSVPQRRENGEPIALGDISGYEVVYTSEDASVNEKILVQGGSATEVDIAGLSGGVYHFAIAAVDQSGLQSRLSESLVLTVE